MNGFEPVHSDIELLRAARTDPAAFGDFYRRHAVAVERWIRAQTPDMAAAADLTAETFAQALVSLDGFRGATDESARGWVYGIARNLVRRYHRRGRVELKTCQKLGIQLDHDPDELAQIESQIDAALQIPELTEALNALPDTQRHALQLRVVAEMDYDEAAARMGTTECNARIRTAGSPRWGSKRSESGRRPPGRTCRRSQTAPRSRRGGRASGSRWRGSSSGPGYTINETVTPGTWVLLYCTAVNPGYAGSGNTGNTGAA